MTSISKNRIFITLFTLIFVLCSCSNENIDYGKGEGFLQLNIDVDSSTQKVKSRADDGETVPESSDFAITIYKSGNVDPYATFTSAAQLGESLGLTVGHYTIVASYGDLINEGFNLPYYSDSREFDIEDGETTNVSLKCELKNAKVKIVYTDSFKDYFSSYNTEVKSTGNSAIRFLADETRAAFFKPGELDVAVNVTRQTGVSSKLSIKKFTAEAKHEYTITLDVDAGSTTLNVTFDDEVVETERELVVSDEVLSAAAPKISARGFTNRVDMEIADGSTPESSLLAYIYAEGGVSECWLTTSSTSLIAAGWPEKVDLCSLTGEEKSTMTKLGLQMVGLTGNKGNIAQIDFTNVIKNIDYDEAAERSTFHVEVVDKNSKVNEEAFALSIKTIENKFTVVNTRIIVKEGATKVEIPVVYNGNVKENVSVKYYSDDWDVWYDSKDYTVVTTDEANHAHTITVPLSFAINKDYEKIILLQCGKKSCYVDVTITDPEFEIVANEGDMWTEDAVVTLNYLGTDYSSIDDYLSGKTLTIQIKKDGDSSWSSLKSIARSGKSVTLSNLDSNTTYIVRAKAVSGDNENVTTTVEITTEAKKQLPNPSFEYWNETSYSYYAKNYPWSNDDDSTWGWDTVNMTTTQKGSSGSYQYIAISGTLDTDDAESGSKGALIRTVGWGPVGSNTAGGNAVVTKWEGTSYNKTPGELYLGSYDSDNMTPNYGMAFTSRPKSLTFYYKYTPCNTDKMVVEVAVENRTGGTVTTLASGTFTSGTAVATYTKHTIDLNYTNTTLKATHLRVLFKSGTDSWSNTATQDDSLWLEVPSKNNLGSGKYVGSMLYIDNVTLGY